MLVSLQLDKQMLTRQSRICQMGEGNPPSTCSRYRTRDYFLRLNRSMQFNRDWPSPLESLMTVRLLTAQRKSPTDAAARRTHDATYPRPRILSIRALGCPSSRHFP